MNHLLLKLFLQYVPLAMTLTPVCETATPYGECESIGVNSMFLGTKTYLYGRLSGL